MKYRLPHKPQGWQFPQEGPFEPKHPASWCKLRYLITALTTWNWYGPYGRAWTWKDRTFTCYLRFRAMPGYGEHYATWRDWWDRLLWEHIHRDYADPFIDTDGNEHTHQINMLPDMWTRDPATTEECFCHAARLKELANSARDKACA